MYKDLIEFMAYCQIVFCLENVKIAGIYLSLFLKKHIKNYTKTTRFNFEKMQLLNDNIFAKKY